MANRSKKSASSTKFTFWILGFIVIFLLGFIFSFNHSKNKPAEPIEYKGQPFLGKSTAPVSIVEFGDYKCPNCKHFAESVVPVIEKDIVNSGKAKFYFMNDSFINVDSIRAAKFAESVYLELGNDTFWKFHELLYKKQPEDSKYEKMDYFTEPLLMQTLKQIATDEQSNKVLAAFHANKGDAPWQKDMDFGVKLGVSGTPTLFVNGKLFDGNTIEDLKKMVDDAVKVKNNE